MGRTPKNVSAQPAETAVDVGSKRLRFPTFIYAEMI